MAMATDSGSPTPSLPDAAVTERGGAGGQHASEIPVQPGERQDLTSEEADPTGLVGDLVRSVRLAAGLTQQELAVRAQTTQSMVARYENDSVSPTVRALARLVAACGSSLVLGADPGARGNRVVSATIPGAAPNGQSDYLGRPASGWVPGSRRGSSRALRSGT
jgi:transcriptional regulator with XRE-family HTH domain